MADYGDLNSLNTLVNDQPDPTSNVGDADSLDQLVRPQIEKDNSKSLWEKTKMLGQAAYAGSLDFLSTLGSRAADITAPLTESDPYGVKRRMSLKPAAEAKQDIKKEYISAKSTYAENLSHGGISPLALKTANFAGNIAPWLAVPTPGIAAGTGLLGRLASGGATGAAIGGLAAGGTYDPLSSTGDFDPKEALKGAAIGGVTGGALSSLLGYGARTEALKAAQDKAFGAKVYMRDVVGGKAKSWWDNAAASLPLVGDKADRLAQEKSFVPAIQNYVKTLSSKVPGYMDDVQLANSSGEVVKKAYDRISTQENMLWKKVTENGDFNVNADALMAAKAEAKAFQQKFGSTLGESGYKLKDFLNLNPEKATFNTIQDIKSSLQKTEQKLWKKEAMGNMDKDVVLQFKGVVSDLKDILGDAAMSKGDDAAAAFKAANEFTANKHALFNEGGRHLQNAIEDNVAGYDFLKKLTTEKNPLRVEQMTKMFDQDELGQIRALTLSKHFHDAVTKIDLPTGATIKTNGIGPLDTITKTPMRGVDRADADMVIGGYRNAGASVEWAPNVTGLDLPKFLNNINKDTTLKTLLGNDNFIALNGLKKVMMDNVAARQAQQTVGGALGTAGTIGALGAGSVLAGNALVPGVVSLKVLNKIAATSPIKNMLIGIERANPNSSVYKFGISTLPKLLYKAGIVPTARGYISQPEYLGKKR